MTRGCFGCASLPRAPFYYTRLRPQCDFFILGRFTDLVKTFNQDYHSFVAE